MLTSRNTRIDTIRTYFRKVDAKDPSCADLFTDDVVFFFPKFGTAHGKAAMAQFVERIATDAAHIQHDIAQLSFTAEGDRIAVEGREWGTTADGRTWPDGTVSQGRFASVFEFEGALIKRMSIYVDPDFTNEDQRRVALYRGERAAASPQAIASQYFEKVAAFWAEPENTQTLAAIEALFAPTIDWDIPGDVQSVPWIGPRTSRQAAGAFFLALAQAITPERFAVDKIVSDQETAVALGSLASRVKRTGQLIETPFAFVLTVHNGLIVQFRLLEDSHAVSAAMRPAASAG